MSFGLIFTFWPFNLSQFFVYVFISYFLSSLVFFGPLFFAFLPISVSFLAISVISITRKENTAGQLSDKKLSFLADEGKAKKQKRTKV